MRARKEFRLARLLRVREIEEQTARALWLSADQEARSAHERTDAARKEELQQEGVLLAILEQSSFDAREVLRWHDLLQRSAEQVQRLGESAKTLSIRAEKLRPFWTEKRAAVRALVRLSDKHLERSRIEDQQAEAAEISETAIQRATRTRNDER